MTGVYGGESVGMAETRGRVGEYTEEAKGRVGEMTHEAQERVGEVAHEAQERAKELGYQAQEQAQQARSRIGDFIDENPLAAGVAAFAIGAAIGLAIPETRREQELMGPTRDKLMERARETAEETMEKVQEAAREVREEGEDEATEQGFVQP